MKMKKALASLLAGAALVVAACGNGNQSQDAGGGDSAASTGGEGGDSALQLGAVFAQSGAYQAYGQPQVNGLELALEEINADGGVLGEEVTLTTYDYGSTDSEAQTLATRLATQDQVDAIVGADTSGSSKQALNGASAAQTPILSPSATADNYTLKDDGTVEEYGYRIAFPDSYQGTALAMFAEEELGAQRVAILGDNSSDYSVGLIETFKETYTGEVVAEENFSAGQTDFAAVLTNLANEDFDVLLVTGYYEEAGPIIRQAREAGIDAPILGPDGFGNSALVELAGPENLNNVYYTTQFTTLNEDPKVQEFVQAYTDKFGSAPDMFAAMAYDAAYVMAQAVERAGSTDREAINAELAKTADFEGVTGTFSYDEFHNPAKTVTLVELQDGQEVNTFTVDPGAQ